MTTVALIIGAIAAIVLIGAGAGYVALIIAMGDFLDEASHG